ncbi:MAG: Asp-tRNA(Asn)/Glu-tRNA(Gln) amidotransferase GatCAB subunit B, partial [Planctomycetota bacterium]
FREHFFRSRPRHGSALNFTQQFRQLDERETTIETFGVSSVELAKLLSEIQRGTVPGPRAKEVFAEMESFGSDVATALAKLGIAAVDTGELEALCTQLLADNPRVVADVKAGKAQAVASLIGQAKKRNANVNPNDVRATCLKIIESM